MWLITACTLQHTLCGSDTSKTHKHFNNFCPVENKLLYSFFSGSFCCCSARIGQLRILVHNSQSWTILMCSVHWLMTSQQPQIHLLMTDESSKSLGTTTVYSGFNSINGLKQASLQAPPPLGTRFVILLSSLGSNTLILCLKSNQLYVMAGK